MRNKLHWHDCPGAILKKSSKEGFCSNAAPLNGWHRTGVPSLEFIFNF